MFNNINWWRLAVLWTVTQTVIICVTAVIIYMATSGDLLQDIPSAGWGAIMALSQIFGTGGVFLLRGVARMSRKEDSQEEE